MRVAILWTGGKDSYSAYEKVLTEGHEVACLITFIGDRPFLCHPVQGIELQAKALGLPHVKAKVGKPYLPGYRRAIKGLIKDYGVRGIATGDITQVDDFHGNWIDDVCKDINIKILRPLWGIDRHKHLDELVASGAKVIFTCVLKKWFDQSWLGRYIDDKCIAELEAFFKKYGIDPCGEGGEYHTMVVDSPKFNIRIEVRWHEDGETETLRHIKVEGFSSTSKKKK